MPAPQTDAALPPLVYAILACLAEGDRHGYAVVTWVAEHHQGQPSQAAVYRGLEIGARAGWLQQVEHDLGAPFEARRRYWSLTDAGRTRLRREATHLAAFSLRALRHLQEHA